MIVFLDEPHKMKKAHLIGVILRDLGRWDFLEKFAQVACYNFVTEHVLLKSKIKK